jgi:phospholipase/carboxylesterase
MHGLGADGNDFVPLVDELDLKGLPGIRFIFPHANTMPVTINGGYVMRAWYDIIHTDLGRQEDEKGLRESQILVEALIAREKARGIPASRIILAGFSQGCAMTRKTGLRHPANQDTPIFLVHGRLDPVIPIARAIASRDLLQSLGYQVEWHEYTMQHSLCQEEVDHISKWLKHVLA